MAQAFIRRHRLRDEDELQSYFIARMGRYLAADGRKLVSWIEIQDGAAPPGATVMVWRTSVRHSPGRKQPPEDWQYLLPLLKAGVDVVLAPRTHFYLDFYQVDPAGLDEAQAIAGVSSLDHVCSFDPTTPALALTPAEQTQLIGVQGALWSECLWDFPKLEYQMFPWCGALAEVAWSRRKRRNFAGFKRRLESFQRRLDELGVHYRRPETIPPAAIF